MSTAECTSLDEVGRILALRGRELCEAEPFLDSGTVAERLLAAGRRELDRAAEPERWLYYRFPLEDAAEARRLVALRVGPCLRQAAAGHAVGGWWWLQKHEPEGWHLRLRVGVERDYAGRAEAEIAAKLEGALGRPITTVAYEPELALFGGTDGLRLAHEFFAADSEFLARWFAADPDGVHSQQEPGMSVILAQHLLRSAGLDAFERWDVWLRIRAMRAQIPVEALHGESAIGWALKLARVDVTQLPTLYPGVRAQILGEHLDAVGAIARRARERFAAGALECGLRRGLAAMVLFHWNRLNLSAFLQARISFALSEVLSPEFGARAAR
jgi:thiopeptide-type bacteriocin biosynthesis protein